MTTAPTPWHAEIAGETISRIKDRNGVFIAYITHREADLVVLVVNGDDPRIAELERQVDELQDEVNHLESKVDELENK